MEAQQPFSEYYHRMMEEYISQASEAELVRLGCLIFRLAPDDFPELSTASVKEYIRA